LLNYDLIITGYGDIELHSEYIFKNIATDNDLIFNIDAIVPF